MWSPLSAAGFISCFLLLLIASVADGRAAISLQKPLRPVVHRPGQFNLTVFKTGFSASPVTIIVEVCYASHIETELLSINPFVLYVLLVVSTIITAELPRSGKLPVINLLRGRKSRFSPRSGYSLHRFKWNLAQPGGTRVRLAVRNFASISARGRYAASKIENFYFLAELPFRGKPFGRFLQMLWAFTSPATLI